MSAVWLVVTLTGLVTIAVKASGPLLAGGRQLPGPLRGVLELAAPALLAALVATQTFGGERALTIDERAAGVAAAGLGLALRLPLLGVVVAAAAVTAALRALG